MIKKLHLVSVLALFTIFGYSQNVVIPDANFKAYLVSNTEINTNGDSEIQESEAIAFTGTMSCSSLGINSAEGIEAFVNVATLFFSNNSLTSIDVTSNTVLKTLIVTNNNLTSINVSQNLLLIHLFVGHNNLTNLDISQNTNLQYLDTQYSTISSLDVSNNSELIGLILENCPLEEIDISNNANIDYLSLQNTELSELDISNLSNLSDLNVRYTDINCIEVNRKYNINKPPIEWRTWKAYLSYDCSSIAVFTDRKFKKCLVSDPTVNLNGDNEIQIAEAQNFSGTLNCDDSMYSDITKVESLKYFLNASSLRTNPTDASKIEIYPNPFHSKLVVKALQQNTQTRIYDFYGKLVLSTSDNVINTSHLANGIYIITMTSETEITTKKMIKQ